MNSNRLVSVIMPFLNTEKFIEESIESVLAQTYDAWELLLVDDGSTDGSTSIAQQYADRHPSKIRYFEHDGHCNRGASASRNLGISNARGEFIAFLDSDDIWLPLKLEQQVPLLVSQPKAGLLFGKTQYWFSWTGNPKNRRRDCILDLGIPPNTLLAQPKLLILNLRQQAAVPCTCSMLIRRTVVEQVGGFEEKFLYIYTDQAFYAKVFLETPVFVVDECWDKYRQHPNSSCAIVESSGQHHAARLAYLNWLSGYLTAEKVTDAEVWQALEYALWPYKYPYLFWVLDFRRQPLKTVKRTLRRVWLRSG